ncbi:hypothetical protein C3942_05850 [Solimonas fluminis]|uniref:Uncharacterized protein n=1 Tax=Solimonas fluminis TaxID=2086571 RepID=A0A2S5TJM4_9GAMM|nr:DUF6882 domain-containing protein [Solimonas fluminis]PPE75196.1 hypothetical protein C3942_05850 [Solimonas fluminis]
MTEEEFEAFVDAAHDELHDKQQALADRHGIGKFARWWFDQNIGRLQFFDADDRLALEAEVIEAGSYSPRSNTWMWAWANPSLLAPLRERASRLRALEELTGYEIFGRDHAFEIEDEAMAWELAAIAVKHLGAMGCYRAPSSKQDGPRTFFALMGLHRRP